MAFHGFIQSPTREPSLAQRLASTIGSGVAGGTKAYGENLGIKQENEALKSHGYDVEGMSPEIKKLFIQTALKNKDQKRNLSETFTPILQELRDLKEDVGPFVSKLDYLNPYSEGAAKRSKIKTLRLSLEGLFRDLTLKGQFPKAIYERILKELPSDNDTPGQYEEKINAIEHILNSHMGENKETQARMDEESQIIKPIFDLSNPSHKKTRDALMKKFKGDRQKVSKELAKYYREE